MHKTFLVFRQEFRRTIRRTGFIVMTFALPVLALLAIGIFHFTSGTKSPAGLITIGFVDESGGFDQFTLQGNMELASFATPEAAIRALINGDITAYFVIPPDFIATGKINRYTNQRELVPPAATTAAIKAFISGNLLAGKVPESTIARVEAPLDLVTITLTATGDVAKDQGGAANFIIPGIFSLLLAFALVFSSIYVLQSLSEEKENRLMEILLSSVSTRQLLAGKVLGLGVAGLAQVAVWVISMPLLLDLSSSTFGSFFGSIQIPAGFLALGVVYFILGYMVFAILSAAVAVVSPSVQEAQALSSIYTLFAIAPFWFFSLLLMFPNSPAWVVFSIFPFSAPVLVMLRLGLTGVPAWQLVSSIATLVLTIVGGMVLAARLLRVYILMYGKRPSLREIARNLRS